MHVVIGKQTRQVDTAEFASWAAPYHTVIVDLGTGDGRYVRHLATAHPAIGCIGVDLCQSNLRETARRSPANALFVVADALALPEPLHGMTDRVTVNFPWGSLLRGLLDDGGDLAAGIAALAKRGSPLGLEIRLNAGALSEAGWTAENGSERVAAALRRHGGAAGCQHHLGPEELRGWPTTWAKRLAYGRDPRAVRIAARFDTGVR